MDGPLREKAMKTTSAALITENMRRTLDAFRAIRDLYVREMQASIDSLRASDPEFYANARPSRWVLEYTLCRVHHLNRGSLNALVSRGILERRPSNGGGPELAEPAGKPLIEIL